MLDPGVPRLSDKGDFQSQFSSPELFAEEPKRGEWMARFARVIAVGIPHHITQRGNARRFSRKTKRIEESTLIYYGKARNSIG
jgi:hypothetical protein